MGLRRVRAIVIAGVVLCFTAASMGDVVTFEGLITGDYGSTPENYMGFNWHFENLISQSMYNGNNSDYLFGMENSTAFSGSFSYSNWCDGRQASVASASVFDFNGVDVTSFVRQDAFQDNSALTLTISGYNSGSLVGTREINLTSTFEWAQVDLFSVDSVVFAPHNGGQAYDAFFMIDNFTFNEQAQVPEPSIPATMISSGLVIILLARRRKNDKAFLNAKHICSRKS